MTLFFLFVFLFLTAAVTVGNKKVNPDGIPIIPKFTSTQTQEIVNMGILEDSFFKFISEFTVTK